MDDYDQHPIVESNSKSNMNRSPRLNPPFWRHDAYVLRRLVTAIEDSLIDVLPTGVARPRVVDFGAGDSPYRPLFESRGAGYIACDIGEPRESCVVPIEIGKRLPFADASADVVVSFQVLEHVWDLDWYLGEARRLLVPEGKLLLSTHGTWLYHPHPTDFRRWTRPGLLGELEERGFSIISVRSLVGPLAWTTQFRALGWHHLLSSIPVVGMSLSAISNTMHFLRMNVEDAITPRQWIVDNAAVYLVVAEASSGKR